VRVWRVAAFPNVLIFYRVDGVLLKIRRILHGAMDLDSQLERA
jgi:plasmid stabilization system protein ParE